MLKERVNELQNQLSLSHSEQSRVSNSLETTQSRLFDLQVQYDKSLASRQAEVDLITADLERAQSLIATLERENEILRNRFKGNGQEPSSHKDIDLELSVAHKEIELARLEDQVANLERILDQERENNTVTVERLNNELQIQRARYDQLASEAAALPDVKSYEAMQQELEVLKVLVYGTPEGKGKTGSTPASTSTISSSGGSGGTGGSGGSGGSGGTAPSSANKAMMMSASTPMSMAMSMSMSMSVSVEQALRDKNRQLESESMKLKLYLGERETEVTTLRDRVGQLESQLTEHQSLVEKLENDLAKKHHHPPADQKIMMTPAAGAGAGAVQPVNSTTQANAGFPPASNSDMLEIVCGQRDRFKIRLTEMEQANDRLAKQLDISKAELVQYRQDNVKLYEKIRYLQSYNESRSGGRQQDLERGEGGSGWSGGSEGKGKGKPPIVSDDLENKYGKLYEDTVVNPFAIFNRKERYRRYRELNHAERVILNTSQFFLSSKGPRLFLFCYSVLLHLLVFVSLYKLAYNSAYPPSS